jgi:uncharacterized coiled-coil protein SlyX
VSDSENSYDSKIRKLEEDLTFLDDHIAKQDKEILSLQKKLDKTIDELKALRTHFESGTLQAGATDEKPPHY